MTARTAVFSGKTPAEGRGQILGWDAATLRPLDVVCVPARRPSVNKWYDRTGDFMRNGYSFGIGMLAMILGLGIPCRADQAPTVSALKSMIEDDWKAVCNYSRPTTVWTITCSVALNCTTTCPSVATGAGTQTGSCPGNPSGDSPVTPSAGCP